MTEWPTLDFTDKQASIVRVAIRRLIKAYQNCYKSIDSYDKEYIKYLAEAYCMLLGCKPHNNPKMIKAKETGYKPKAVQSKLPLDYARPHYCYNNTPEGL